MPDLRDAPTNELGYAAGVSPARVGGVYAGLILDSLEEAPDLRFPASATLYDRMRRSDGQLASVIRAMTHPIMAQPRKLAGDDVRPQVMRACEAQFGLQPGQQARRRRPRNGLHFAEHLRHALLSPVFGFMPFEQVYEVGPPLPGLEDTVHPNAGGKVAHLRKLAPRMPRTLQAIEVAADGGLEAIVQTAPPTAVGRASIDGVRIPVDRLVYYCPDREGADWSGMSILRAAYKHWLIKDALLRLGPMVCERNGMGVPVVTYPEGGSRAKALAMARAFRAGAEAGVAVEAGYTVTLVGVTGSTRDELPLVEYHDKAASRSLLAMFLDLGHSGGLGESGLSTTFVDIFLLSLGALVSHIEETFTEHVIRDWVELNYGADEPYPYLEFDELTAESTPTAEALATLADAGLITKGDRGTEQELRRRYRLPALPELAEGEDVDEAAGSPFADVGLPALVQAGIMDAEEARRLLKLPPGAPIPPDAVAPESDVFAALAARPEARRRLSVFDPQLAARLDRFSDPLAARLDAAHARLSALAG